MSKLRLDFSIDEHNRARECYLPGYLGIKIIDISQGSLTCRMEIEKHHFAPNNFVHAGSIVALADSSCGYATIAHLPEGADIFTTIELKANYLGTVREGAIVCVATAQHFGRNTQVWDAVATDEASGKKLALFRCTQMILWPKI